MTSRAPHLAALFLGLAVTIPFGALHAPSARAAEATKGAVGDPEPIAWETSYSAALTAATSSGKPIVFKFYTGWCPHCTRMDKTTWKDESVAKAALNFVAAKVNADVEKVPVRRYGLVGYPTVIVAEPGGEQVVRLEGYKDGTAVAAVLSAYTKSADELKTSFATLAKDSGNPAANVSVGAFYAGVGLHAQAAERYQKAQKSAKGPDLVTASAGAGAALVRAGDPKAALKALQAGESAAGPKPPASFALAMGEALAGLSRKDEAKSWLERVLADHGDAAEAASARKALAAL